MSELSLIDHLLAVTFAIGFPAISLPLYVRRRAALEADDSAVRRREYVETICWLAGMGVATVAVWLATAREPAELGLGFPTGWRAWTALAVAIGLAVTLFQQPRAARRDEATRAALAESLESVREFIPKTREELRLFRGLSFSAGIGEEIFFRGFLLWYLGAFMPLWAAVVVSSILFGAAHLMHGANATVRSTITGAALAGLYLFAGALWAPMILHTAIDLTSGETGYVAFGPGR